MMSGVKALREFVEIMRRTMPRKRKSAVKDERPIRGMRISPDTAADG
jgi:hypothetical protein